MLVEALCSRQIVTALRVGRSNVRRFFPRKISSIEFELDHLRIECKLTCDFWNHASEIRDRRLCLWLRFKISRVISPDTPALLAMIPTGKNRYKLELADVNEVTAESGSLQFASDLEWQT
jgi:hypothetical protein